MAVGPSFASRLMRHVVSPIFRVAPAWAWVGTATFAAAIGSPLLAWRRAGKFSEILRSIGRDDNALARWQLARLSIYRRLRALDFYMDRGTRRWQLTVRGEPVDSQPCCYVMLDVHGMEHATAFMDRFGARVVRAKFGHEITGAADDGSWAAHCAALRHQTLSSRTVEAGGPLAAWRAAIADQRPLLVFQGNVVGSTPVRQVLDRDAPMPLGAARVARLGRMPLRFMRLRPRGLLWEFTVEAPMPADEDTLLARIEQELRADPEGWILWPLLLARPVSASRASPPAPTT